MSSKVSKINMNDAEKIIQRLKQASYSTTDANLADVLNVRSAVVATWKKRNKVPYEKCVKYALKNPLISLDWLIFEKGNMLRGEKLDINKPQPKAFDPMLLDKITTAVDVINAKLITKLYQHFEHQQTPTQRQIEAVIHLLI